MSSGASGKERRAVDSAGGEMMSPAVVEHTVDMPAIAEGPGTTIGHYKLLQKIGEGGFGVVYMAEQQHPVRRMVALKIIKPGMDTREVIARFESERQALALMDHPNIARVLDAGATASGRPYFVMELVKGVPITEYCDKNNSATEQRLELFCTVCYAVQHAHQKGVIHRDIKPSNVMVTLHDGKPVPKVIDFGVAKATTQRLTERTLFTAYGQMVGTPAYMSPEQAEMSGLDIDTRSDIYSLGVLLYELLTGTTPLDSKRLREMSYGELQRIIREEDPPKPSTRVSTLGEKATIVSSHRSTEPAKLRQFLRGDLDLIVMKSLEKERSRRYETPSAFAEDIGRFLRQEAIVARGASALYRARKFAQRNRAAVITAAAIAACLLAGTAVSTLLAIQAMKQRDRAEASLVETQKQRKLAEEAQAAAELERDRAEKAKQAEAEQRIAVEKQRQLAEEQQQVAEKERQDAIAARMAESEQRTAAERERDRAQALNEALNQQKEQQRRMLYVAQMNLIQKAWDADNVGRVTELLAMTRPRPGEADLRGFEWYYWQRMCHRDERTLKLAPPLANGFVLSADASRMAAVEWGANAGVVGVWDMQTGQRILSKKLPASDAMELPTTGPARTSTLYWTCFVDAERTAAVIIKIPTTLSASDYTRARQDCTLRVYRIDSGEELFSRQVRTTRLGSPNPFAFSRDGTRVVGISEPEEGDSDKHQVAEVWDGSTGESLARITIPFPAGRSVPNWPTVSPDGKQLAMFSSGSGGGPQIVDLETGATKAIGGAFTGGGLQFSPDGTLLAGLGIGAYQRTARIWKVASGEEVCRLSGLGNPSISVQSLVFSPDGKCLANYTDDDANTIYIGRTLKLWSTSSGRELDELKGHKHSLATFGFSGDGRSLVSFDRRGVLKFWHVPSESTLSAPTPIRRDAASNLRTVRARSDDGRWLAGWSNASVILEDTTGELKTRSLEAPGAVAFVIFSPDGRRLAAASVDEKAEAARSASIQVWDVATMKAVSEIRLEAQQGGAGAAARRMFPSMAEAAAFSQSGDRLAMHLILDEGKTTKNEVRMWNVDDGREVFTAKAQIPSGRWLGLRFSPQGDTLLSAGSDSFDAFPRTTLQTTGRVAINTMFSSVLQAWDTASGQLRWQATTPISLVRYTPDGKRITGVVQPGYQPSASVPPAVMIWDSETGEELVRIALDRGRVFTRMALSADGGRLAVVDGATDSGGAEVGVYDAASGEALSRLQGEHGAISGVAFSPDGKRLVTAAGLPQRYADIDPRSSPPTGGKTKIWDVATGQELLALSGGSEAPKFFEDYLAGDPAAPLRIAPSPQWSAARVSAGVEAEDVVEHLLASGEGGFPPRGELVRQLEEDSSLSADVRTAAMKLIAGVRRDASVLNEVAWTIAKVPGRPISDYEQAVDYAREACEGNPKSALNLNTLGVAQYRAGKTDEAAATLQQCLELRDKAGLPQIAEDLLFLAMAQDRLGQAEQARDLFRRSDRVMQARAPSSDARAFLAEAESLLGMQAAATHVIRGDSWRTKGKHDEALSEYEAALRLDPESPRIFANRGYSLFSKGDYARALVELDQAIKLDPQLAWAYAIRGSVWRRQNQAERAVADYGEAIRLDPKVDWYHKDRAAMHQEAQRYEEAIGDYSEAIRLAPRNAQHYIDRGYTHRLAGHLDEAIKDYDEAIRITPGSATAFNNRGYARERKGELDAAIKDYDEAIRLNPKYTTALHNRGNAWRQKRDYDRAIADYDAALALDPKRVDSYNNRGNTWLLKNELEKGLADYDEAIRLNPKNATAHYNRGRTLMRLGDYGQAFAAFDQSIQLDAKSPALNTRTWLLATCPDEKFRDGKRAVEEATKGCELSEWKDGVRLDTLAAAQAECGNFQEAVKRQEQAVELASGMVKEQREARLALYREGKPYRQAAKNQKTAD